MKALVGIAALLLAGGCAKIVDGQKRMLDQSLIQDAVARYEVARNKPNLIDRCVKAGQVAAAYQDAHDVTSQSAWAARRDEDCRAAYAAITQGRGGSTTQAAR